MNQLRVWIKLRQYTEVPLIIDAVDERLSWERHWTSWRGLDLKELILLHIENPANEATTKTSTLITEEISSSSDSVIASSDAYNSIRSKLNVLSSLSNKGFSIQSLNTIISDALQLPLIITKFLQLSHEDDQPESDYGNDWNFPPIFSDFNFTFSKEEAGFMTEGVNFVPHPQEEPDIKRTVQIINRKDISDNWDKGYFNFMNLPVLSRSTLNQSMEFYRNSLMSRDLFSRYLLDWTAIDVLGKHKDKMGDSKIKIMAEFFGKVNGISNFEGMLHKLYDIRNDIAHNRKQQTQDFLKKVKIGMLWLEWIMECFYKTKLGLEQRPEAAAPKYEL